MYALDTNTLIYFFTGQGEVARRLLSQPPAQIAVPVIVIYELETGIAKSAFPDRREAQLGELLDVVSILAFERSTARRAASLRAQLESAGQPIGPLDTLIAATALTYGATLVTHNTSEFARVPNLDITDWYG